MKEVFFHNGDDREERWWWPFPIAYGLHSSDAVVFGRAVYGEGRRPVTRAIHRAFKAISDIKYAFKYRFVRDHRYNVVFTDLKPGYHDEDSRILHACMACLGRFIEASDGVAKLTEFSAELRSSPDPNAPDGFQSHQADFQDEAVAIWRWWTIEKPRDEQRRDELLMATFGKKRSTWKPTDNPKLSEWVAPELDVAEESMVDEMRRLEKKIDDDEEAMLIRLMKIRRSLWT